MFETWRQHNSLMAYLPWGWLAFATWKLGFMVISWAQLRFDRSLADFMTSSRLNTFGGLAV